MKIWVRGGKVVVNDAGDVVECDDCPCVTGTGTGSPPIPSGDHCCLTPLDRVCAHFYGPTSIDNTSIVMHRVSDTSIASDVYHTPCGDITVTVDCAHCCPSWLWPVNLTAVGGSGAFAGVSFGLSWDGTASQWKGSIGSAADGHQYTIGISPDACQLETITSNDGGNTSYSSTPSIEVCGPDIELTYHGGAGGTSIIRIYDPGAAEEGISCQYYEMTLTCNGASSKAYPSSCTCDPFSLTYPAQSPGGACGCGNIQVVITGPNSDGTCGCGLGDCCTLESEGPLAPCWVVYPHDFGLVIHDAIPPGLSNPTPLCEYNVFSGNTNANTRVVMRLLAAGTCQWRAFSISSAYWVMGYGGGMWRLTSLSGPWTGSCPASDFDPNGSNTFTLDEAWLARVITENGGFNASCADILPGTVMVQPVDCPPTDCGVVGLTCCCDALPSSWKLSTHGWTDNTGSGGCDCTFLNGDFTLNNVGGCVWQDTPTNPTWKLYFTGDSWQLQSYFYPIGFVIPSVYSTFGINHNDFDCLGSNTLYLHDRPVFGGGVVPCCSDASGGGSVGDWMVTIDPG